MLCSIRSSLLSINLQNFHVYSVSLSCMPTPQVQFKLQPHICDCKARGLLNRLRAGDAGLGNRRPNIHGSTTKWCPLCLNNGLVNHLTEHHVVVSCQAVAYERSASGLRVLMTGMTRSSTTVLTGILGGDNASKEVLLKRADMLSLMLDRWMVLAGAYLMMVTSILHRKG